MLSIGKLVKGQEGYYLDAVARGVEDYYLEGEAPGRWLGSPSAFSTGASRVGHPTAIDDTNVQEGEGRND